MNVWIGSVESVNSGASMKRWLQKTDCSQTMRVTVSNCRSPVEIKSHLIVGQMRCPRTQETECLRRTLIHLWASKLI